MLVQHPVSHWAWETVVNMFVLAIFWTLTNWCQCSCHLLHSVNFSYFLNKLATCYFSLPVSLLCTEHLHKDANGRGAAVGGTSHTNNIVTPVCLWQLALTRMKPQQRRRQVWVSDRVHKVARRWQTSIVATPVYGQMVNTLNNFMNFSRQDFSLSTTLFYPFHINLFLRLAL